MIQPSYWRLEKTYFTAKPVDDFFNKYKHWFIIEDGYFPDSAAEFAEKINKNDFIQIYQFPKSGGGEDDFDYFELADDNYVIPRHLFTVNQD